MKRRSTALMRMALTALAVLAVTGAATAQYPPIAEIQISVQDIKTKEILGTYSDGGTLRLSPGDQVRLRLVAIPRNDNRNPHYPSGTFQLNNSGSNVVLDVNAERGSAVLKVLRMGTSASQNPFIRYNVTERIPMAKGIEKGVLNVELREQVSPVAPPVVQPEPPAGEPLGVTLFEHQDFRGRSQRFTADDPQLNNDFLRQDMASSIRIDDGCKVTLYEHPNYQGRATVLTQDEVDLRNTRVGSDTVSSLEVDCRQGGRGRVERDRVDRRGEGAGVTLFEHQDFRGRSQVFYDSDPQLSDDYIRQDTASSIRVDPGCKVTLYEHPDFTGRASVLTDDEADLGRTRVGNDSVSSIEVDCRGRGR